MSTDTLIISPKFTIEDIHKVRENNYNKTKNMTEQEFSEISRFARGEIIYCVNCEI